MAKACSETGPLAMGPLALSLARRASPSRRAWISF